MFKDGHVNQKLIVVLAGVFTVVFMLEVGLRFAGYVRTRISESAQNEYESDNGIDQFRILCLGNSFTEGVGAPKGESYPDHLQNLFDTKVPGTKVKVINKGKGALNSSELFDLLEVAVEKTKPDLVILRTGGPNYWNHHRYRDYLRRTRTRSSLFLNIVYSVYDMIY